MGSSPKILYITSHCPGAPTYGAQLRALHIGRLLSKIGPLSLIIASSNAFQLRNEWLEKTRSEFNLIKLVNFRSPKSFGVVDRCRHEFDSKFLKTFHQEASESDIAYIKDIQKGFDVIWLHSIRIPDAFGIYFWPASVLDVDDLQSQLYLSAAKTDRHIFKKIINTRMSMIWKRRERNFRNRFGALSVCSENDKLLLCDGSKNVFVVPNGFEKPEVPPVHVRPKIPRIGFIGTFEYQPNVMGIEWFVNESWPEIKKNFPNVRLRIIGNKSDIHPISRERDIDCLGWVENAGEEMSTWTLAVVPVLVGGGTRIKIADAFSKGIPVVSTSLGAFGYDVSHGQEILLADNPRDFGDACMSLFRDSDLWVRLSRNAWNRFVRNWTWDSYIERTSQVVESVLRTGPAPPISS